MPRDSLPPPVLPVEDSGRRLASPEFEGRRLRVGLFVDSTTVPAWVAEVLRQTLAADFADVVCVVVNAADPGPPAGRRPFLGRVRRWIANRHALLYAAYKRLDRRRYPLARDPWATEELRDVLQHEPATLAVTPRMTKFCDYFGDDDIARIEALSVDVFLRFGFRILKGKVLQTARFGVWSFHHGNNAINRGGPAGFWEVWHGQPTTGAVLQRLSEDLDAGQVLDRCFVTTDTLSVGRNGANLYWQAAPLMPRMLRQLYQRGPRALGLDDGGARPWEAYSQRMYVAPASREIVTLFWRLLSRLVVRKLRAWSAREQWLLAYRFVRGQPSDNEVPDGAPHRFIELAPPADRIWADPFPVSYEGRHYVFFEEFRHADPHAHICVLEFDEKGAPGTPRPVLKQPYHLSYPNVFRWNGAFYMLPETARSGRVELYRATNFPDAWELHAVLLEGVGALDPTIAEVEGQWWLMCTTRVAGTTDAAALDLYYADSPVGPWRPHPGNPVKVDVRSARPAGRPFRRGGRLYRPAQDGSPVYGSAIVVNEVIELSPTAFREVEVARISPDWRPGLTGTHTLNAAGGLTVIDIRQRRGSLG